jgi:hypothetical protein
MFGYILVQLICCVSFIVCQDTCQKTLLIEPSSASQIILNDAICYTSMSSIKSISIASSQPIQIVLVSQVPMYNGKTTTWVNSDYTFTGSQITLPSYELTRNINLPSAVVVQNLSTKNNTITVMKTGGVPQLSPGAIAGIVIACIVVVVVIIFIVIYIKCFH